MNLKDFFQRWWIFGVLCFLAVACYCLGGNAQGHSLLFLSSVYLAFGFVAYLWLLHQVGEKLRPASTNYGVLLLFGVLLASTALLILFFAAAWHQFFSYGTGGEQSTSKLEAVYFSATVLLTVGFGDNTPIGPASKILMVFQAAVGMAHFVTFFAVGFTRLGLGSRNPT